MRDIYILCIMLVFNLSCKNQEIEWKVPKSEIKNAIESNQGIKANLTLIPYDKFNSVNIEFTNLDSMNLLLNDFWFPDSYLKIEKKIEGKFQDISNRFLRQGDCTMKNNIPIGEGDSIVRDILGSDYFYLDYQDWSQNRKSIDKTRKQLRQYLYRKESMDSSCIDNFLSFLNVIPTDHKISYHVFINKTFIKGSIYKIYLKYSDESIRLDDHLFCTALFYKMPPIDGFEIFKGSIVSDTLYLNCD